MDVVKAVSGYITKMMSSGDGTMGTSSAKMKILLLDSETVSQIKKSSFRLLLGFLLFKTLTKSIIRSISFPRQRHNPHFSIMKSFSSSTSHPIFFGWNNCVRRTKRPRNGPPLTDMSSRLDNQAREKMSHLRCLCFVRPSPESIQFLIDDLREPKYGEYYLCTDVDFPLNSSIYR